MPRAVRLGSRLAVAALLAAGPALPAQPAAPEASETPETSETPEVIAVPVQVLKDGAPVRGLAAGSFELYDGRKRRPVTGFEAFDLTARPTRPDAVPAAARRRVLLLFDLAFSDPAALVASRQAALDLARGLPPGDLVAVGSYAAPRGAALVLGFTPDRAQAAAAIERLGMPELAPGPVDGLSLAFGAPGAGEPPGAAVTPALLHERIASLAGPAADDRDARRDRVLAFSRALTDLGRLLASVDGRKEVVLFSGGFERSLLFEGLAGGPAEDLGDGDIGGPESEDYLGSDSDERYERDGSESALDGLLAELRRADCTVLAVDAGGGGEGKGREVLAAIAEGTGGELSRDAGGLSRALARIAQSGSAGYVLAFEPGDLKADGKYHRLRVEVKGGPPGAKVVHRPGYYAPRPPAEQPPLERRLAAADRLLGGAGGPVRVSVLAAPFATGGPQAYVPVVVEVDGRSLLAGTAGDTLPAEIHAYGLTADGGIGDSFSHSLGLDLKKTREVLLGKGLKFYGHLDLAPGDYSLRVLVVNGRSGGSSLAVLPLAVPDVAAGRPLLLPPFFPEPPGGWLLVREGAAEAGDQIQYPFVLAGEPYIPAARPVIAGGTGGSAATQVELVAYNLNGDLAVEGRVLDRDGREVPGARLRVLERAAGSRPGIQRLRGSFEPAGLPPGDYTLVVSVTDPGSKARQSSSAPFVVARAAGR